ncbi:unnamed protein product [Effrenium voratum]|uniref:Uncharacterized protein n=1 Tax=Effrenium voratum TaxID=2562239 RepID=A0AA36JIS2_9DINO|nr:unnamed protein product [Effrenium voratum]
MQRMKVGEEDVSPLLGELAVPGRFFFFMQDAPEKNSVMMTCKLKDIPEDARDFRGKVCFEPQADAPDAPEAPREVYIRSRFEPLVLPQGPCQGLLQRMRLEGFGQILQFRKQFHEWMELEGEEDTCKVSLLLGGVPMCLGHFETKVAELETRGRPKEAKLRKGLRQRSEGRVPRPFRCRPKEAGAFRGTWPF